MTKTGQVAPDAASQDRVSGTDFGDTPRLEELLGTATLSELAASLTSVSGLGVAVRSSGGVDLFGQGSSAAALLADPADGVLHHGGESFLVAAIEYDHDAIGRVALGPFRTAASQGSTPAGDGPTLTVEQAQSYLAHFLLSLDLILHAAQRAIYASTMHLASIEESYSELLRKNKALEEAYARLKELDHLKSSFLATVSHELRTPLTSIIGYSDMLAEGMCGAMTKDQLEYVQTIRQKGDQLLSLIMSLLDLSKLDSGTLRMHAVAVPIESILQDAMSTLGPAAAKKGVKVTVESSSAVPAIRADPDRLRQVFVNLVENAVKFTPKGGHVSLVARETEAPPDAAGLVLLAPLRREIEVRVKDTGLGIPTHERTRVFDPFYQVDQSSTREQGGTGLGLAIVKRIVEAHQGRIRVEGNEPTGAVFVVNLPLPVGSGSRPRVEP